jgi:transcriptional regulator with XRE-family HTH domain
MKQPELGRKISEFRREKGLTQEQLSEKSRINIRTIQRIEAGEVIPRANTLKIILEILGRNFEEINGTKDHYVVEKPGIIQIAWIAGTMIIACNIFYIGIALLRDVYLIGNFIQFLNAPLLMFSMALLIIFNLGIIQVGKTFDNSYLVITAYIGIVLIVFANLTAIARPYVFSPYIQTVAKMFIALNGINGIFYGTGLILLKKELDDLALVAGIVMILASVFLIVPVDIFQFMGLFVSVPSMLLQIILFYKVQTKSIHLNASMV